MKKKLNFSNPYREEYSREEEYRLTFWDWLFGILVLLLTFLLFALSPWWSKY